jgi:sRNA-binding regulator protein Hfq
MGNNTPNPYWGKALQYQQKTQAKSQVKQQQQRQQENKPRDFGGFDSLVVGRECVIKLGNGEVIRGLVSAASKYFYLVTVGGQVMIVNKAYVVMVMPTQTQQNNNTSTASEVSGNDGKTPRTK